MAPSGATRYPLGDQDLLLWRGCGAQTHILALLPAQLLLLVLTRKAPLPSALCCLIMNPLALMITPARPVDCQGSLSCFPIREAAQLNKRPCRSSAKGARPMQENAACTLTLSRGSGRAGGRAATTGRHYHRRIRLVRIKKTHSPSCFRFNAVGRDKAR